MKANKYVASNHVYCILYRDIRHISCETCHKHYSFAEGSLNKMATMSPNDQLNPHVESEALKHLFKNSQKNCALCIKRNCWFSPWLWKCHSCPTPRICMEDVIPIPLAKHIETYSMYYYRTTVDRNETLKYVRALRYISFECGIWRSCTFLPILSPKNPLSNDLPSWIAIIAAVLESYWGQDIQGWFHLGWAPSSLSWRWVLVIS